MFSHLRPTIVLLTLFSVIAGLAYPLAITGFAQFVAPAAANGSLVTRQSVINGSDLIGQGFTSDRYIWPRPSAAGEKGFDAPGSSGSNLGPLCTRLISCVRAGATVLRRTGATVIPADALTDSASGLDPHISPDFAVLQVPRIAAARKVPESEMRHLLVRLTEHRLLGFVGEPRVNVLRLNLAHDASLPGGAG